MITVHAAEPGIGPKTWMNRLIKDCQPQDITVEQWHEHWTSAHDIGLGSKH